MGEKMSEDATKTLDTIIKESLDKHPQLSKYREQAKTNPQIKALLASMENIAKRTVTTDSLRRIDQMRAAGSGDILAEMPGIVNEGVKSLDLDTILPLAAPQPILLGASEPGQTPLTVLSHETVKELPRSDPHCFDNEKKAFILALAKQAAGGA